MTSGLFATIFIAIVTFFLLSVAGIGSEEIRHIAAPLFDFIGQVIPALF